MIKNTLGYVAFSLCLAFMPFVASADTFTCAGGGSETIHWDETASGCLVVYGVDCRGRGYFDAAGCNDVPWWIYLF